MLLFHKATFGSSREEIAGAHLFYYPENIMSNQDFASIFNKLQSYVLKPLSQGCHTESDNSYRIENEWQRIKEDELAGSRKKP